MSKTVSGKHYSKELIAQVITDYAEHIRSAKQLAAYYNVPYNTIKYWIKKYNKNGMDALLKPRSGRKCITYDDTFKLRVTEYWLEHPEISSHQIADIFHASRGTIRSWRKIYLEQGSDALKKEMRGKKKNMKNGKRKAMIEQTEISDDPKKCIEALEKQVHYLQMENDYLKKIECLSSGKGTLTKAEKVKAVTELRQKYELKELLEIADIPRSTYYYVLKTFQKEDKHIEHKQAIKDIFDENKARYGYRRITMELRNRGICLNHKTVLKLMNEMNLYCKIRRKKYNFFRGEVNQAAANLIQRDFHAEKPNQKWTTDVTEFALLGKKVYLSPILDMYNREIIAYSISLSPNYRMITDMLEKAFRKIPDKTNLIFHSDQGWCYRLKDYKERLEQKGIRQSMSRKGNCLDNSIMENFFGLLKSEMFYGETFASIEDFIKEIENYIDYYNHRRIKGKLKGLSPVDYRNQSLEVA